MGLFKGLFGKKEGQEKKEEKTIPWILLTTLDQLQEIESKSKVKTQIIFKHSTTCGISRMVINSFKKSYDFSSDEMDLYYLDLHAYREVSSETGYKFQILHQSPQLIVIKDGAVVAHSSHGAIAQIDLNQYV